MDFLKTPSGPRAAADLALETTSSGRGEGEISPSSRPVKAAPLSRSDSEVPPSSRMDALQMYNIDTSLSYRALHSIFKPFGTVLRIRLIYDEDCLSNRCYVTFASGEDAQSACGAVASLPVAGVDFKAQLIRSANITDSDTDYVPNLFEDAVVDPTPKARHSLPPRWFVAYYRNGRGNFISAARYLAKEIGTIPDGNLKKYGKGVLIKAKDTTQAKMLQHLPCPADSMFESVKAHHSFNFRKGCVYNHDLYEFPEEEIIAMCPNRVYKVVKMKGSSNMVLLTFYGTTLPEYVNIGPLKLRVKPFIDRPLQCYSCYGYGHGKRNCTEHPRCGNCSALNTHSMAECEEDTYCFHCRDGHQLRSRQCPRYRLEQDILQLANSQFISLGSARRELLYRQKAGTGAKTYASLLGTRSSADSAAQVPSSVSSRPSESALTTTQNRFSLLSCDSVESPPSFDGAFQASSRVVHVDVHAPHNTSPKLARYMKKRYRGSTDSIESVPPTKIIVGVDCGTSQERSVGENAEVPMVPAVVPSVPDPVSSLAVPDQDLKNEESLKDNVDNPPREPVASGSGMRPRSRSAASKGGAGSFDKIKLAVPRPDSSRVPVLSSRRITLPKQVGKGQSLPGARLERPHR